MAGSLSALHGDPAILVCTLPCFDYLYQPPGMLYVSPELLILCDSAYLNEFCMALTLCKDSGVRERERLGYARSAWIAFLGGVEGGAVLYKYI